MKSILLQSLPILALAGSLSAQLPPTSPPTPIATNPAIVVLEDKPGPKSMSLTFPGGDLQQAIESVQNILEHGGMEPVNVVVNLGKDHDVKVPPLTLRNVTGSEALMLIATAAGLELKPVQTLDGKIVGWEFRPQPKPATVSATRAGNARINIAPVVTPEPPKRVTSEILPPPIVSAGSITVTPATNYAPTSAASGPPPGIPGLSSLPIVGQVFTTGAPPPFVDIPPPLTATLDLVPPPAMPTRETRVYALGIVTNSADFPDVEKTLREMLETDGIRPGDVKLSFHEKTNVLVANGTPRTHELITQLLQALSRDFLTRDAQNNQGEIRDLRDNLERRAKALDQAEKQLQELHKSALENEVARMKAEMELKLFKDRLPKGQ